MLVIFLAVAGAFVPSHYHHHLGGRRVACFSEVESVEETTPTSVVAVEEEASAPKGEESIPLEELQVGKYYDGIVTGTTSYGCFVNIGASSDGLVHISELSDRFVSEVSSVVSEGDAVSARVLKVDTTKNQLSLSLKPKKERRPPPKRRAGPEDLEKYASMDPQNFLDGKVVSIKPFGAFVNLEPGVDGLVHISRISEDRVENVEDVLQVGQEVKVRIIDVDLERVTIGLAMTDPRPPRQQDSPPTDFSQAPAMAPDSAARPSGRRSFFGGESGESDGFAPRAGKPKAKKSGGYDDDNNPFPEDDAPRKRKFRDPGDDIWEVKPHERFDWKEAMAKIHEEDGFDGELKGGISIDPKTGKLALL
ncbi:hypothetical protein CTAYLR_010654 [Chrysophaeum taylorii]|uniref:S1 motif domain-containing protein n=1 Tax=Chrysophaeum taylorii TaxID=2483200 RepID=A0AAD7UIJ5_9STRA|nr:hypothetical protein CTAYLR_010654 [Chrysophaeum taylorii]